MTSQGNGQPIPYHVSMSGLTRKHLRELHRQEAEAGRGQRVISAFREIVARLQRDPLIFGEPRYHLPVLKLLVRQGAVRPLVVDYAVHETQPVVFIRGFTLLS
jgi:hypothetical protein